MSRNILRFKRFHDVQINDLFPSDFDPETDYNDRIEYQNKLLLKSKTNSSSSGSLRIIVVLKNKKKFTLKTDNITEFQKFSTFFNCLYYIENGIKYYIIENESIENFFYNSNFNILYDSEFPSNIKERTFLSMHNFPKRKDIKEIRDFCFFPEYIFESPNHKYFYTSLYSPTRILKFYRLSFKNYPNMSSEFTTCSNSKITKFYGPKGTGKSTFIYAFFGIMSGISIYLNNIDEAKTTKENLKINDLKLNFNNNVEIKKYKKPFNQFYEVNKRINEISNSSYDSLSESENNNININEDVEKINLTEIKINNKLLDNIYYIKEFKSDAQNEDYYFLSSVYIDLDKERTPELSSFNKKYFELELMLLFKTFKFYQLLLIYLNGNKKDNIFDKIKQIIQFMLKVKNNRNYFIILDHVSEKEEKEIIDLENYVNIDPFCYLIELPLIITKIEKLKLLKDLEIKQGENLESFDNDDKITFIKRKRQYGIIYSTNYYIPEIVDNEDKIFQNNFGNNIYLYCLWKYSINKININDFISQVYDEIIEIFTKNYLKDQNLISFNMRTLIDVMEEKKEITNLNFLSDLPLEYFVLIKKEKKFILEYSFPLIEKIVKKLNMSSSMELLRSKNFITYFDGYIKQDVMEKVFGETLEKNYDTILKHDIKSINIQNLLDNKIRDYFDYEEEIKILKKNKTFQTIRNTYNNLKFHNIIFNQFQNVIHFDKCLRLFNNENNYVFFQVIYHKSIDDLTDILSNLWINLNYMINKIIYLCKEENETINGIYVFFVLMDLESYVGINTTNEQYIIINDNKENNLKCIEKLNKFNIDYLFLNNKGAITKENEIIQEIPLRLNLISQFKIKINEMKNNKITLEDKCLKISEKLFPNKNLNIIYYNPYHKKKKGFIMFNLFEDNSLDYFEIEGNEVNKFYNLDGDKLDNNVIYTIEKKNIKKRKMNVLIKIS